MDEEHYRRLIAEGVEPWNRWRAASAVMPQLEGASLIEVKLTGQAKRSAMNRFIRPRGGHHAR